MVEWLRTIEMDLILEAIDLISLFEKSVLGVSKSGVKLSSPDNQKKIGEGKMYVRIIIFCGFLQRLA